MDSRKLACIFAAGIGLNLVSAATSASANPGDLLVVGDRREAEIQRTVPYTDLNLALASDQKILGRRIAEAAWDVCSDFHGQIEMFGSCPNDAIRGTDDQVAAAIGRAQRQIAGLPVGPAVAIAIVATPI